MWKKQTNPKRERGRGKTTQKTVQQDLCFANLDCRGIRHSPASSSLLDVHANTQGREAAATTKENASKGPQKKNWGTINCFIYNAAFSHAEHRAESSSMCLHTYSEKKKKVAASSC